MKKLSMKNIRIHNAITDEIKWRWPNTTHYKAGKVASRWFRIASKESARVIELLAQRDRLMAAVTMGADYIEGVIAGYKGLYVAEIERDLALIRAAVEDAKDTQ